jgi:hypothetical protein
MSVAVSMDTAMDIQTYGSADMWTFIHMDILDKDNSSIYCWRILSHYKFCLFYTFYCYTFCPYTFSLYCFIVTRFVIMHFVSLYLLSLYVMSFQRFVFIRFVVILFVIGPVGLFSLPVNRGL